MWDNTVTQQADVRARTLAIIAQETGLDPAYLSHDHLLVDTLGFDSRDLIELALILEREVDIAIDDADAEQAGTVGLMLDLVERLTQA